MNRPSVYESAGGAPAFRALAADFHARCLVDEQLEHPFSHTGDPHHVEHLAEYWGEVLGGPPVYSTSRLGHSGMLDLHARNGMEPALGEAFVRCFDQAVEATLPPDPELRGTLHAYMEWAVGEVKSYDAPDAVVPDGLPIPHWDWSGPVSASVAGS
ncbi:oxidoreductase [Actinoplanes sp. NPDC051633]|uniref:globin domain-containing protein n=1 Tax=Actinoplanes sp. NPDC051633 TaxID=3155670 RepID=UPI003412B36D